MYRKNNGVTLVEVAVAIALFLFITLGLMPSLLHLITSQYKQLLYAKRYHDISQAVTTLQLDLSRANKFLRTPNPSLHDTETPAGSDGWHFTGSSAGNNLILSLVATDQPEQTSHRQPVYIASTKENCTANIKEPLTYNAVYYVHNNNLYRRTLLKIPTNMTVCSYDPPYQQPSTLTGSPTHQKDLLVLRDVAHFSVSYHEDGKSPPSAEAYKSPSTRWAARKIPLPYRAVSIEISIQNSEELGLRNEKIHIKEALL